MATSRGQVSARRGLALDVVLAVGVFVLLAVVAAVTNQTWSWVAAAVLASGVIVGGVVREVLRTRTH